MDDAVGVIGQTVYLSFLWLVYREDVVSRGLESLGQQGFMQGKDIGFTVAVVHTHAIRVSFPTACLFIGSPQVLNAYYLSVQIAYAFHTVTFCASLNRSLR